MKTIKTINQPVKVDNSCGKEGCSIQPYILPYLVEKNKVSTETKQTEGLKKAA